MTNEPDPLVQRWQEQQRTPEGFAAEEIRAKSMRLESAARHGQILAGALMTLLVLDEGWQVIVEPNTVMRVGHTLILAAAALVAYRYRRYRTAPRASALGATTGVEFYRAELIRQYELSRDGLAYLLPFAPGLTLIVIGRLSQGRSETPIGVLVALAVGVFVVTIWMNGRGTRRLRRELDAMADA